MVSSLDNWDGSLSSATKQNASRITDLAEGSGATTVQDERINAAAGVGHGWHGMATIMDVNHAVRCCLLDGLCIVAQVAIHLL